jgi:ACR3 family arsenite transporter
VVHGRALGSDRDRQLFELAGAIVLFGFQSGAALSAVVGMLVEVLVLPSMALVIRRSRPSYERGSAHKA